MSENMLTGCRVRYLHYMLPMDNLTSVLVRGILPHNKVMKLAFKYNDVSDVNVQTRRRNIVFADSGKSIHDYVPLYFATQTPMQYVITHCANTKGRYAIVHQKNLVFIDMKADTILRVPNTIFTDGNAAVGSTNFYSDLNALDKLDWETITCPGDYASVGSLCYDKEWQRIRASEVLVPNRIPKKLFSRIVVLDTQARARLLARLRRQEKKTGKGIRVPPIKCRTEVEGVYYYEW